MLKELANQAVSLFYLRNMKKKQNECNESVISAGTRAVYAAATRQKRSKFSISEIVFLIISHADNEFKWK